MTKTILELENVTMQFGGVVAVDSLSMHVDKGEIVEQGTHEELLAKQGCYYRLWELQQGNFIAQPQVDKPVIEDIPDSGDEVTY